MSDNRVMLYSRQIQPVCIWSVLYHGKVLQTFSKCNLSNITHKFAHVFKMVFPVQKPPQGGSKFPRISAKIGTKFWFKTILKIPVRKAHQGRSNLFQNIFFSQIFLGRHLFSTFFCGNLKFLCKNQSQIALVRNFASKSSNRYIISFP